MTPPVTLSWRVVPTTGSDVLLEVRVGVRGSVSAAVLSVTGRNVRVTPASYVLGSLTPPTAPQRAHNAPVVDRAIPMRTFRLHAGGSGRPRLTLELRWGSGVLRRSIAWPAAAQAEEQ